MTLIRKLEGPYKRVKFVTMDEALAAFNRANLWSGAKANLLAGKRVSTFHDEYQLVCQGCYESPCVCKPDDCPCDPE